ncbi:MAG TPA: hypothetical protein VJA94_18870 [Candidatus Angelobacter sp.]
MAERENEKRLDELLDSFLARYSDAQPRPGFQTRLLANLRTRSAVHSRITNPGLSRLLWAAATATVLIAVTLTVYFLRVADLPEAPTIRAAGVPVLPAGSGVVLPPGTQHSGKRHKSLQKSPTAVVAEVRQQVFPSPEPLSEQEQLLLRYLARTPKEEVAAQSRSDEPAEGPEPLVPQVQQFLGTETRSTR